MSLYPFRPSDWQSLSSVKRHTRFAEPLMYQQYPSRTGFPAVVIKLGKAYI